MSGQRETTTRDAALLDWLNEGAIPAAGPASMNTDDAPADLVLAALRQCAASWQPGARVMGNVRAGDVVRAATDALRAMGSRLA